MNGAVKTIRLKAELMSCHPCGNRIGLTDGLAFTQCLPEMASQSVLIELPARAHSGMWDGYAKINK